MHESSEMRTVIATDVPVAWCVCLSRACALQKRLNRSTGRGGFGVETGVQLRNTVLGEGPEPSDSMRPLSNFFDHGVIFLFYFCSRRVITSAGCPSDVERT